MQTKMTLATAIVMLGGCAGLYPDIYSEARNAASKRAVTPIEQITSPGIFGP
jgi:hypothetical protein